MKIATIARDAANSPHMMEHDTAILKSIEQELAAMGHCVVRIGKEDIFSGYDAIFHMSREHETLQKLKTAETEGCRVINSPTAVINCSRLQQMTIMQKNNIQQPPYQLPATDGAIITIGYPGWIKKSEGWSQRAEDVAFVTNEKEAAEAIKTIGEATVYCKHIEGDIIKFYGVKGGFFKYSYPDPEKTKFGHERVNGTPKHHPFNKEELQKVAFAAAEAAGLEIFGGDCIVTAKGDIFIIDLNDFPSFRAVRYEAAREIARIIEHKQH